MTIDWSFLGVAIPAALAIIGGIFWLARLEGRASVAEATAAAAKEQAAQTSAAVANLELRAAREFLGAGTLREVEERIGKQIDRIVERLDRMAEAAPPRRAPSRGSTS